MTHNEVNPSSILSQVYLAHHISAKYPNVEADKTCSQRRLCSIARVSSQALLLLTLVDRPLGRVSVPI